MSPLLEEDLSSANRVFIIVISRTYCRFMLSNSKYALNITIVVERVSHDKGKEDLRVKVESETTTMITGGELNPLQILREVHIHASTKDSMSVSWRTVDQLQSIHRGIRGFQVRYQAFGSTRSQETDVLQPSVTVYDITHLHENTYYDVCVRAIINATARLYDIQCVTGTTAINGLSLALGSTFGAFLALGVIVLFVMLAKWQHVRRRRKLLYLLRFRESMESLQGHQMNLGVSQEENVEDSLQSPGSEFSADIILHEGQREGPADETTPTNIEVTSRSHRGHKEGHADDAHKQGDSKSSGQKESPPPYTAACQLPMVFDFSTSRKKMEIPDLENPESDLHAAHRGTAFQRSPAGVIPFLRQQGLIQSPRDTFPGGRSSESGSGIQADSMQGNANPIVRLKLRKHPTFDYSAQDENDQLRTAKNDQPENNFSLKITPLNDFIIEENRQMGTGEPANNRFFREMTENEMYNEDAEEDGGDYIAQGLVRSLSSTW